MHTQRRYATCSKGMLEKKEDKKKERCIPKEGMPHAHKACKKKRREKDSPHPRKGERWFMRRSSYTIHPKKEQKKFNHTLAHFDQGLCLVSSWISF